MPCLMLVFLFQKCLCRISHFPGFPDKVNHWKCQKAYSGIVSGRQGLWQARTLARRQYKKRMFPALWLNAAGNIRAFFVYYYSFSCPSCTARFSLIKLINCRVVRETICAFFQTITAPVSMAGDSGIYFSSSNRFCR